MVRDNSKGKRTTIIGAAIAVATIVSSVITLKNYLEQKKANQTK